MIHLINKCIKIVNQTFSGQQTFQKLACFFLGGWLFSNNPFMDDHLKVNYNSVCNHTNDNILAKKKIEEKIHPQPWHTNSTQIRTAEVIETYYVRSDQECWLIAFFLVISKVQSGHDSISLKDA